MTNEMFSKVIDNALKPAGEARWGLCPLDFSEYQEDYNYGLVVIFPYEELITPKNYREDYVHDLLERSRAKRKVVHRLVAEACEQAGIPCVVTPIPDDHQQPPYIVPFSTKHAAVQAGMGWLGKSSLLVTKEFGPRLTSAGFALRLDPNSDIAVGVPERTNHCGDCDLCVKMCPWNNITGKSWEEGVAREELVDYHQCSVKRFSFEEKLGRKMACAKCIVWCPYGTPDAPTGE